MNAARSDRALEVLSTPVEHTGFGALRGRTHVLLVTYKRDGTGVPTPVWFAQEGDRLIVWTEVDAFKAKRARRDPRALVAPCGPTGIPHGPPIAARVRVLEDDGERAEAARAVRAQWGPGRRLFERLSRPLTEVHYLELVPAGRTPGSAV